MKTNQDDWCPRCFEWMPINKYGECVICLKHIVKEKNHISWFEQYGIDSKEFIGDNTNF